MIRVVPMITHYVGAYWLRLHSRSGVFPITFPFLFPHNNTAGAAVAAPAVLLTRFENPVLSLLNKTEQGSDHRQRFLHPLSSVNNPEDSQYETDDTQKSADD